MTDSSSIDDPATENQGPARAARWRRRRRWLGALLLLFVLSGTYLAFAYHEPRIVTVAPRSVWGFDCLAADDLVIQQQDSEGDVWATRGLVAYCRRKGKDDFVRAFRVPTGRSAYWLMNLSFVRALTHRRECVELLPLPGGSVCAMAGGHLWHKPATSSSFRRTLTLDYYGLGVGRGIFPNGLTAIDDNTILFGEYHRNDTLRAVRLYVSRDKGQSWQVAHEFPPGRIRHVHAVQKDPYSDQAWVCTGDEDDESMIAWTRDAGTTLHPIGQGSQTWRTCQLVFTETAVYWGADTGKKEQRGIYRWDRNTQNTTKVGFVPGHVLFGTRLEDGTVVMSTNIEAYEDDDEARTRLWVVSDDKEIRMIACGSRASYRTFSSSIAAFLRFAYLRLQRTQGTANLHLTCHNVEECDGDLLIIPAEELRKASTTTRPTGTNSQPSGRL